MLENDNLLTPIEFDLAGEAGKFANRHRCAECQSHLMYRFFPWSKMFSVYCPIHGARYDFNVVKAHTSEMVTNNELTGARELRPDKPPRPASEILDELF